MSGILQTQHAQGGSGYVRGYPLTLTSRSLPGLLLNPDTPSPRHSDSVMELGGVLFSRPVFLIWTLKEESLLLLLDTSLQLPPLCVCLQIGCLPPHPGIWLSSRNGVCWTEQFRAERPWQRGGRQLFWPEFHPPTGSEPTLLSFLLPTTCPPTRLGQGRTHLHKQGSGSKDKK